MSNMNLPAGSDLNSNLLESGYKSDFTIVCDLYEFKVHQAILGSGSEYFAALFCNEFKETIEKRVQLDDDNPEAIYQLLSYIYTGSYPILLNLDHKSDGTIMAISVTIDLTQTAPNTIDLSQDDIRDALRGLVLLSDVADKHNCGQLGSQIGKDFRSWIDCLHVHPVTDGAAAGSKKTIELIQFILDNDSTLSADLRTHLVRHCSYRSKSQEGIDGEVKRVVMEAEPVAWVFSGELAALDEKKG